MNKAILITLTLFLLSIALFVVTGIKTDIQHSHDSDQGSVARAINLSLYSYALDHGGKYPKGKSSTEVFQKLIDEKYADHTDLFYSSGIHDPNSKLVRSENVCWDITCCIDKNTSSYIPVVFRTGYKITYHAGGSAVSLDPPGWWPGLLGHTYGGIAVAYKDSHGTFLNAGPDGTIPNFIPADFDPKGKTYRQLTPDGKLPP